MEKLSAILPELEIKTHNSPGQVAHLEVLNGRPLPDDFKAYLCQCGGAVGPIGETGYIALWDAARIDDEFRFYKNAEMFKGLFIFGSNGGGEAYAIDFRGDDVTYVGIPFIGDEEEDAVVLGKTIWEMFEELKRQSLE